MQVSVQATKGLERKMTVSVPADQVENEIDSRLRKLGSSARIKGFRPGKVPFKVVKQHYGAQVQEEVVQELLRSTYTEALNQEKLNPASGPKMDPVNLDPENGLEYTATFEVYPEVKLKGFESLKVEKPVVEISSEDTDRMIKNLRKQRGTWEPKERTAKHGDRVIMDFEGDVKGKPFAGNRGEDVAVELGAERMVPGFEMELEGLKAGEEKDFEIKYPKDYPAEEVAGKKAHFHVTIKEVSELILPDIDDEFCKGFGITEGGEERLRADITKNMQGELEKTIRNKIKDQLLDGLVMANKVDVPNALVDDEVQRLQNDAAQKMGKSTAEQGPEMPRDLFEEQARRRVTLGLLIGQIIEDQQLKADADRIQKSLEDLTDAYDSQDDVIRSYRNNPSVMHQVEGVVLEEQAVNFLLEHARVTDKSMTFAEIMNFGDK
ncbi:MAG: trigger factor [Gammaproteobacteria bacterium]